MSKRELKLYLSEVNTQLVVDIDLVDEDLFLFGFEEHKECKGQIKSFKTEQILDKEDLKIIRALIDSALSDAS